MYVFIYFLSFSFSFGLQCIFVIDIDMSSRFFEHSDIKIIAPKLIGQFMDKSELSVNNSPSIIEGVKIVYRCHCKLAHF